VQRTWSASITCSVQVLIDIVPGTENTIVLLTLTSPPPILSNTHGSSGTVRSHRDTNQFCDLTRLPASRTLDLVRVLDLQMWLASVELAFTRSLKGKDSCISKSPRAPCVMPYRRLRSFAESTHGRWRCLMAVHPTSKSLAMLEGFVLLNTYWRSRDQTCLLEKGNSQEVSLSTPVRTGGRLAK
jgi:hypothetical protein